MKYFLIIILVFLTINVFAQERELVRQDPDSYLWLGSYNKFRLTDKLYWVAQFHYRRSNTPDVPLVGKMAQIYNRHALNYVVSPNFNFSLGGVLRLNFTPQPGDSEFDFVVPEPRIWHQYMFVQNWPRFIIYNRLRIEHRWSISNREGSEWIFRNRWRYKLYAKIPLNNKKLVPGTFYLSPDAEIILQSGAPIIDSPIEDLRLLTYLGYIKSPRVTYSAGLMYTTGQNLNDGSIYRQRWVVRLNAYISLDFRKEEQKIPTIKLSD